jgi:hypothetical protein
VQRLPRSRCRTVLWKLSALAIGGRSSEIFTGRRLASAPFEYFRHLKTGLGLNAYCCATRFSSISSAAGLFLAQKCPLLASSTLTKGSPRPSSLPYPILSRRPSNDAHAVRAFRSAARRRWKRCSPASRRTESRPALYAREPRPRCTPSQMTMSSCWTRSLTPMLSRM